MKKTVAALLLLASAGLVAPAQTEFRHITFDEACTAAANENKLVFVDFFTTWCGPCKMMSSKTFPEKKVGDYMNAKFIPVKLDAEKEGADLAKKFKIAAYPTYIVANSKGQEVARFSGYMEGDDFIAKMDAALDPEMKPERIAARYQSGERTPKLVNAYAMQFMEKRQEEEGFKVIDDYFKSLSDAQRLAPENAFLFTTYTIDLDNDRAAFMDKNLASFPAETSAAVTERLKRLYGSKLQTYFSGYVFREGKYNADEFAQLKKRLADLGMADGKEMVYAFIEKRPGCTDAEYLDFFKNNFGKLSADDQQMAIMNMTRLIEPSTPEIKSEISKFLRANISTMPPYAIQLAGYTLGQIEGK